MELEENANNESKKDILMNQLKFGDKTLKSLKDALETDTSIEGLNIFKINDKIIVENTKDINSFIIIFINPIRVTYNIKKMSKNEVETDDCVISTIQIDNKISKFNSDNALFYWKDIEKRNYLCSKDDIQDLDKKEIFIEVYVENNYIFNFNNYCLKQNKILILETNNLSKYFKLYFKYNQVDKINYFLGQKRKELFNLLTTFYRFPNVHIFKICGPSNNGKSTSLLVFSRTYNNIVYFNLKTIAMYFEKDNNDNNENQITFTDIIFYEIQRVNLNKFESEQFSEFFNRLNKISPSQVIYEVLNYLKKKKYIIYFRSIQK